MSNIKAKRPSKAKPKGLASNALVRQREAVALAKATWSAAKGEGMYQDDLVACCAILLANVSDKTGEPLDYLLSEVARRTRKIMPNAKSAGTDASEKTL